MASQGPTKVVSNRMLRRAGTKTVAKPSDLTYKSSVADACVADGLSLYEILLPVNQRAWRYVYASPSFLMWYAEDMPKISVSNPAEDDPIKEQLEIELHGFAYGHLLRDQDDIKCLEPLSDGVWQLKTPDIRLFGWFPERDYFVIHAAEAKANLLTRKD